MQLRSGVIALALLTVACSAPHDFVCGSDGACDSNGADGRCIPPGYCSIADATCPSGQRYVEHAPDDISGTCVNSTWGLVGHWALDERQGIEAHDDSGDGYDGQLKDGPTWTSGRFGGALQFTAVGSRVEGKLRGFGQASITASAWTKSTDTTPGQHRVFGAGFADGAYFFLTYNGGQPRLEAKSAPDQYWDCGTANLALADGTWHELGFVMDRTRHRSRFYVDGVIFADCAVGDGNSAPFGAVDVATYSFIIGAQSVNIDLSYVGVIDEVGLWDRALEDAEMKALATNPK